MAFRSLLFVPGNRPDRFDKACQTEADLVCIDLEDAVSPDEKAKARETVLSYLSGTSFDHVGVRLNALDNDYGQADVKAFKKTRLDLPFIMVPKVANGQQITALSKDLPESLGALFPVVESAKGVRNVDAIFDHPRVKYSIFGAIDYSADIGSDMEWETMLYARSHLVASAHAYDVTLFDTPYSDVRDPEGCRQATERAKKIGIFARSAIHPTQVTAIHDALRPSEADIAQAQRVIEAMEAAGGNVALLDGKLLEEPVVKKARRVLDFI